MTPIFLVYLVLSLLQSWKLPCKKSCFLWDLVAAPTWILFSDNEKPDLYYTYCISSSSVVGGQSPIFIISPYSMQMPSSSHWSFNTCAWTLVHRPFSPCSKPVFPCMNALHLLGSITHFQAVEISDSLRLDYLIPHESYFLEEMPYAPTQTLPGYSFVSILYLLAFA